ncbi:MAG: hypothetical protein M3R04_05140, partial [bacterium]|nr:hypothetical protein [bacterium]
MLKLLIATLASLCAFTLFAHAESFTSTSGIADLGGGKYLLVDDTKDQPELASRPRLRVATLVPGGTVVQDVFEDWGSNALPNDLEAVAPLPGQSGHFLVAESGYFGEKYGRIFHITVEPKGDGWASLVVGTAQLPIWLLGGVEGIAVGAKPDGGLTL